MKRPQDERLTAMQFESIKLTEGGRQTGLYAIEGVPGVFRRYSMTPASARPPGHVLAFFGGTEIVLARAKEVEEELAQAGFVHASPDVTALRPAERRAVLDSLFLDGKWGVEADGEDEVGEGAEKAPEAATGDVGAATEGDGEEP